MFEDVDISLIGLVDFSTSFKTTMSNTHGKMNCHDNRSETKISMG